MAIATAKRARRARVDLSTGVAASDGLVRSCVDFVFTDRAHGESDDVSLTLTDVDGHWRGGWSVPKGAGLSARIICTDWTGPGESLTLDCGSYEVDELELSGPPDMARIKATAVPVSSPVRRETHTRGWESTTLEQIGHDIASKHGLGYHYSGPAVAFERLEQRQESDLAFLKRIGERQGINVKVADSKLVMFDAKNADAGPTLLTVRRGQGGLRSYSFRGQASDTYGGCDCSYWDPKTKQLHSHSVEAGTGSGHRLQVNERVESPAEAERVAAHTLREKNQNEYTGRLELLGEPRIYAGGVIVLAEFGMVDGRWAIKTATHRVDRNGGYTTCLEIRRTLDY